MVHLIPAVDRRLPRKRLTLAATFLALAACQEEPSVPQRFEPLAERPKTAGAFRIFETEWGTLIAQNEAQAAIALVELRAAAAAFHTYFGIRIDPGCLVALSPSSSPPSCDEDIRWRAVWVPPAFATASFQDEERQRAAYRRLADSGVATASPALQLALAGAENSDLCRRADQELKLATHVRHEIMHRLYVDYVWANSRSRPIYGGDAPDWLDEAAAMLSEPAGLTRARHARYALMLKEGRQRPLGEFMRAVHPSMEMPARPRPSGRLGDGAGATVRIRRVDPNSAEQVRELDFYAQSRALADYLIARSGDLRVLRALSEGMKSGASFERWTAERFGLSEPGALADFERDFTAWVARQDWNEFEEAAASCI